MLNKLKKKMFEKIGEDAIESYLDGEKVLMKKGGFPKDWNRFYPPVEKVNGELKWNLKNFIFGGKNNLIRLIMILGVITLFFLYLYSVFSTFQNIIDMPCVQSCLN